MEPVFQENGANASLDTLRKNARSQNEPPVFASTIQPGTMILEPLIRGRGEVFTVVPPGFSPKIYELQASTYKKLDRAHLLIQIKKELDGSLKGLEGIALQIELLTLVPPSHLLESVGEDSDHRGGIDPHFWTDPIAVLEVIDPLVQRLCAFDPSACSVYTRNGEQFKGELQGLHREASRILSGVQGGVAVFHHPSFRYLTHRYGIQSAGYLEPFPGKESSPAHIGKLIGQAKEMNAKVIFTEPQLSSRPGRIVAGELHIPLRTLDPLGGKKDGSGDLLDYRDWFLRNARELARGLQSNP